MCILRAISRRSGRLTSHACIPGSNPADPACVLTIDLRHMCILRAISRRSGRLTSHACIPGSNPADPACVFLRQISLFLPFLGHQVNGGLELRLKPVYLLFCSYMVRY